MASHQSSRQRRALGLRFFAAPVLFWWFSGAAAAGGHDVAFRIYTADAGVYRVAYADLTTPGSPAAGPWPSATLRLSNRGVEVPLWIEDGGDGSFDSGDWFEFVAEELRGLGSYYHEYSPFNVYRLSWSSAPEGRVRMQEVLPRPAGPGTGAAALSRKQHLEEDRLLVRLTGREAAEAENPELWFWSKLTHLAREPLVLRLDLDGLDRDASTDVTLEADFRGLSTQLPGYRVGLLDHSLALGLAGLPQTTAAWDGREAFAVELPPIAAKELSDDEAILEMRLDRRVPPGAGDPIVDVVVLNWVEIEYPHRGQVGGGQLQLRLRPGEGRSVRLMATGDEPLTVYGGGGERIEVPLDASTGLGAPFELAADTASFWALPKAGLLAPAGVEVDKPSSWSDTARHSDYLLIAHASLLEASSPLAEFHRSRGLDVSLVDVQDLYDEFNHGILDPRAIKDFVAHAYHRWEKPAPRYVLLVGDASWDTKNLVVDDANYANWADRQILGGGRRFAEKERLVYDGLEGRNQRNLVPSHSYHSSQGHAASDNWFVSVDGDDSVPELAIGRFPVAAPAEVEAIVAKTIRYATDTEPGPWRNEILWIANEWANFQRRTDELAAELAAAGFTASKLYPRSSEASSARDVEALTAALDRGQLLVHFMGHGGRFIWRTGPPDLENNYDLFDLDDIDALQPNHRLPVVLSLTCHSGPFDHPDADSIAEKFLRVEGKGAIAVVSAAWRTTASTRFSRIVLEEFTKPGTIGDAFLRAKQRAFNTRLRETYNLFGDPGAPLALRTVQPPSPSAARPGDRP